jgi:hypothetical protein
MMRRPAFLPISALCAVLLAACNPITASLASDAADVPLIRHLPSTGSFSYTFAPSSDAAGKSVYFVFTNTSLSSSSGSVSAQAGENISVNGTTFAAPTAQPFPAEDKSALPFRGRVASFGRNILLAKAAAATSGNPASIAGKPADQDVGGWSDDSSAEVSFSHTPTTADFCTDLNDDYSYSVKTKVAATCCLVRDVSTASDGAVHRLSIWAADEATSYLTKSMVRALADKFFAAPESSTDIYHWDTAVLGQPWGSAASSPFVSWDGDKTITILLAPLNSNYDGAVVVGMFWPKDNYSTQAVLGSNQRIMFYVDSKLYGGSLAGGETSWGAGNYWPTFVFSTLAHEFQHMIHFYQKQVRLGAEASTDAWINEMCSMVMEDLVSDPEKMNNPGPRGVISSDGSAGASGNSSGRIPIFNYETSLQLDKASDFEVDDYSTAYAFGAWLARNYGGSADGRERHRERGQLLLGPERRFRDPPDGVVDLHPPLGPELRPPRGLPLQHGRLGHFELRRRDLQAGLDQFLQLLPLWLQHPARALRLPGGLDAESAASFQSLLQGGHGPQDGEDLVDQAARERADERGGEVEMVQMALFILERYSENAIYGSWVDL